VKGRCVMAKLVASTGGWAVAAVCTMLTACAAETGGGRPSAGQPNGFDNSPTAGAGGAGGAFDNGVAARGGAGGTGPNSDMGSPNDCGGETFEGEVKARLDIFVVFDLSGSMFIPTAGGAGGCYGGYGPGCATTGGTPVSNDIYGPTSQALRNFVNAPESSGIGIAIKGYNDECDVNVMATPEVPMETLPMNAAPMSAWLDQKAGSSTYGNTQTVPALQGGVQFMRQWLPAHPESKGVILLVTDGEPDADCAGDDVPAVAAEALAGSPSIPTYVLGLGNIASLNAVAAAGGTGQAFVVSDPATSGTAISDSLNAIRGAAQPLPCEFLIPAGGERTPNLVNMDFTATGAAAPTTVPRVDNVGACGAQGGWYYDDPAAPRTMLTCESTCGQLSGGGGRVDIALGCPTVVLE